MEGKIYTVEELMLDDSFLDYCLNTGSTHKEFWEEQIRQHAGQQAVFAEARYTITLLHGDLSEAEVNRQIEKIKSQIGDKEKKHSHAEPGQQSIQPRPAMPEQYRRPQPIVSRLKKYMILGVAASVLVFSLVYLFQYAFPKQVHAETASPAVVYRSGAGERRTVQLPDGSSVILNSNSSISLENGFNHKNRTILLEGEGFFRVAKDPTKPFIVTSGPFSATAIGTAFYVHARNVSADYHVDLLEGKLRLAAHDEAGPRLGQKTILLPGETGSWRAAEGAFAKTASDTTVLNTWVSGKLLFKDLPVENVLKMLEQWYAVSITVRHKPWNKLRLTGDYDNVSLDDVLKVVCFSLSAHYSYSGNQVIIE